MNVALPCVFLIYPVTGYESRVISLSSLSIPLGSFLCLALSIVFFSRPDALIIIIFSVFSGFSGFKY